MTATGKSYEEAKKELEALVEQKRQEEIQELVEIVRQDVDGRFKIDTLPNGRAVYLWYENEIVASVINLDGWRRIKKFAEIMAQPGDRQLQEMEYQSQESPESRRNGYGYEVQQENELHSSPHVTIAEKE